MQVFNGHMRWSIESFVHWGISTLAGLLVHSAPPYPYHSKIRYSLPDDCTLSEMLQLPAKIKHTVQGIIALASGNAGWLSLHVVLGGLAAAALTAHDAANFALLEFRCRGWPHLTFITSHKCAHWLYTCHNNVPLSIREPKAAGHWQLLLVLVKGQFYFGQSFGSVRSEDLVLLSLQMHNAPGCLFRLLILRMCCCRPLHTGQPRSKR